MPLEYGNWGTLFYPLDEMDSTSARSPAHLERRQQRAGPLVPQQVAAVGLALARVVALQRRQLEGDPQLVQVTHGGEHVQGAALRGYERGYRYGDGYGYGARDSAKRGRQGVRGPGI